MTKKILGCLCASVLVFAASVINTNAWTLEGFVFCDANTNLVIDSGDGPVQGVLVVVTNTSGTFSNAVVSDTNGFYSMDLGVATDDYVDFILPESLPTGTTLVTPATGNFTTDYSDLVIDNDFLVENPGCVPVPESRCSLTGGGTFKSGQGQPIFTFTANVNPGCSASTGDGANLNVVAHDLGLHFKGRTIEVIGCGNLPDQPAPAAFNYVDFQGTGTLQGIAGNHFGSVPVSLVGHVEDLGQPGAGADAVYLRVFDPTDTNNTLLLISATPEDPMAISPLALSTGNLQLHSSSPCPPDAPTLVSPGRNITNSTMRYTWSDHSKAAWYRLCVVKSNNIVWDHWYSWRHSVRGKEASKFAVDVPGHSSGQYHWWVQGWNEHGLGAWSRMGSFAVPDRKPGVVKLTSAGGAQTNTASVRFTWAVESKAVWYELCVVKNGRIVIDKWYAASSSVIDTATGQFAVDVSGLSSGTYHFWVRAWNYDGLGPWSSALSFNR